MFNGDSDPLSSRFPRLFSYVLQPQMSAAQFYNTKDKSAMFYLPISQQAHDEFLQLSLQMITNSLSLDRDI
jgi:hypothetical protein